jgi:hypothetical protein
MRDLWAAPLDLRRAFGFGLCIADSFGEHLAKLSLGLRRLACECENIAQVNVVMARNRAACGLQ